MKMKKLEMTQMEEIKGGNYNCFDVPGWFTVCGDWHTIEFGADYITIWF
jgi:hypothetical protein